MTDSGFSTTIEIIATRFSIFVPPVKIFFYLSYEKMPVQNDLILHRHILLYDARVKRSKAFVLAQNDF
jgi:hypothetical protein